MPFIPLVGTTGLRLCVSSFLSFENRTAGAKATLVSEESFDDFPSLKNKIKKQTFQTFTNIDYVSLKTA